MSDRDQLISFGFDPARVDWALRATKNSGLQVAMDHCLDNAERPIPTDTDEPANKSGNVDEDEDDEENKSAIAQAMKDGGQSAADAMSTATAKSLKCDDCGKVFRNEALAGYHGDKSGHTNFSQSTEEIKPLTEEEKAQKLEELKLKLAEKRKAQQASEIEANKANEKIRRKAGQETGSMKEEMKLKQALKEAAERKADKLADAKAKQAIKLQIEADKKERAEKFAREKAIRDGTDVNQPSVPAPASTNQNSASSTAAITRLQLKFSNGPVMTLSLPSESKLRDVEEQIASQRMEFNVGNIIFTSKFPRITLTSKDMLQTLRETGLSPSASLEVTQG